MIVTKSEQIKYTVEFAPGRKIEAHVKDGSFHSMYYVYEPGAGTGITVALPVKNLDLFIEGLAAIEGYVNGLPTPEWR